jgi:two-component system response regulator YesN
MIRVMIVEDEKLLRESVMRLMDWTGLGCEVVAACKNGLEAKAYLQHSRVDLVITDIKMPGMNGIELCREIRENYSSIEIIILSAYTEFQYAKDALKYQVNDFIVKSEFIEELPKALRQVLAKMKQKSQTYSNPNRQNMSQEEIERTSIHNLLDGQQSNSTKLNDWIKSLGLSGEHYNLILSSFSQLKHKDRPFVLQLFQLAFSDQSVYFQWLHDELMLTLIALPNEYQEGLSLKFKSKCDELMNTFQSHGDVVINIAVSHHHVQWQSLPQSYQEAKLVLQSMYRDYRVHFYGQSDHKTHRRASSSWLAEQLLKSMEHKDKRVLESSLEQVFMSMNYPFIELQQVKLELSFILRKCTQDLSYRTIHHDQLTKIEEQFHHELVTVSSFKALFVMMQTTLEQIMKLNIDYGRSLNPLVVGVRSYIHMHYQKAIKLDDIADSLHFNSSYVSRMYKKETGESVIHYLNRYRVEKAKQLIESRAHKISEIGELVGIEGMSYFSSLFTKIVGVSPQQYRKHQ